MRWLTLVQGDAKRAESTLEAGLFARHVTHSNPVSVNVMSCGDHEFRDGETLLNWTGDGMGNLDGVLADLVPGA